MSPMTDKEKAAEKARKKAPGYCCEKWQEQPETRRRAWPWQVAHQWAHSRTSFTAATLADRAGVELPEAEEIIKIGNDWKWYQQVPTPGTVTVYAGNLTKRS